MSATLDRTALLARAASRCAAMMADPRLVTEYVIRHHPVPETIARIWAAGELLGEVGPATPNGWHVARAADGTEEPVRSVEAGREWLLGRARFASEMA